MAPSNPAPRFWTTLAGWLVAAAAGSAALFSWSVTDDYVGWPLVVGALALPGWWLARRGVAPLRGRDVPLLAVPGGVALAAVVGALLTLVRSPDDLVGLRALDVYVGLTFGVPSGGLVAAIALGWRLRGADARGSVWRVARLVGLAGLVGVGFTLWVWRDALAAPIGRELSSAQGAMALAALCALLPLGYALGLALACWATPPSVEPERGAGGGVGG